MTWLSTLTHLGSKVRYADELLKHILGKDIGITSLLDIIG